MKTIEFLLLTYIGVDMTFRIAMAFLDQIKPRIEKDHD